MPLSDMLRIVNDLFKKKLDNVFNHSDVLDQFLFVDVFKFDKLWTTFFLCFFDTLPMSVANLLYFSFIS
jgi:hypothetical protein